MAQSNPDESGLAKRAKGVRPIVPVPHRRPFDRTERLERKLRARAEQFNGTEQLKVGGVVLGLCHGCKRIVYAGDSLAMSGVYLFHDGCCAPAVDSAEGP